MDMLFLVHTLSWVNLGSQESRSSLQLVSAVDGLRLGWKFLKCFEVDGKKEFIQQSFWEYVVISRYTWWDAVKNIISCVKKVYIAYTPLILAFRNGIPNRRKITMFSASRLQPCGWTMLHWRLKLVQRRGLVANPGVEKRKSQRTNFDPSIGLIKNFQLWEPLWGGGPKLNVPANFHAMGLTFTTLASLERCSGVAGSSLHMATPTAVSRVGDFVAWLKKTSRHHRDISRTASVHYLRGAASGVHLCWPSSHRMTNWGAPEWIFWIQQVVELVVVRQLDNVWYSYGLFWPWLESLFQNISKLYII